MEQAISLSSGIGGLDIGFAAAGFDIIAQSEIDQFCQRVLKRHANEWWPNATIFGDVRQFGITSLPGIKPGDIAAIFGGFPCQPYSVAGKRLGAKDNRDLWPEFRRIIGEFRPRAILLENVPGILTGYAVGIIADLTALGYDCRWGTIRASDTGAPHKRERWFCMAYAHKHGSKRKNIYVGKEAQAIQINGGIINHCNQNMGNAQNARKSQRWNEQRQNHLTPRKAEKVTINTRPDRSNCIMGRRGEVANQARMGGIIYGIPSWLDKPRWPAGQGVYQYEWEVPRTIDKGIDPNRSSRIKALGNAVVPHVAYALAVEMMKMLTVV
jgi:DNA (cytosine-5)-methyltransferase 1